MAEPARRGVGRRALVAGAAAAFVAGCSGGTAPPERPGPGASSPTDGGAPTPSRPTTVTPGANGRRPATPDASVAPPAAILARSHVPVLCFHQVRDWTAGDSRTARTIITPPRRFAAQMAALAGAGYSAVTPDRLLAYLRSAEPLPPRPVLLTFDDASEGQYANALPVLLRHHFTATFFVMTVVLDKPRWLSRAQVRDLHRRGMSIGSHSWDHHPATRYSGADWRIQLDGPARELARIVGQPVRLFAYPYGLWNRAALPHVRAAGYEAAFQLDGRQDPGQPLLTIRRIIAASDWDGHELLARMRARF